MKKLFLYSLLFVLLANLSACKKEKKWKLPADVQMKMDIHRTAMLGGNLAFTGGYVKIENFTFTGDRQEAEDVSFTKNYPGGLHINFDPVNPVSQWNFEIPQGTYNKITISFDTYGEAGDDHLVLNGTYKNSMDLNTYPVRVEIEAEEFYSVMAKSASGGNQVILDKNIKKNGTIKLNPVYWFQLVSVNDMDNATLVNVNSVPTILISDSDNTDIFDLVSDRIDDATEITFD